MSSGEYRPRDPRLGIMLAGRKAQPSYWKAGVIALRKKSAVPVEKRGTFLPVAAGS